MSLRQEKIANLIGGVNMFGNMTTFEHLFDELRRMEQGIDQIFGRSTRPAGIRSVSRGTFPPTNVGVTENEVHVYLFAPGLDAKSFSISMQQNLLLVSGNRELPINEKATYFRQERFEGEFRRVVTLPEDIDPERVEAKYRDGILQISLRRRETAKPRQILIN
ncbi:MAG: Hsp20/alpha crystallin family protein [Steroidobacteraceae bacterium]|jgi:HSP20 family protein